MRDVFQELKTDLGWIFRAVDLRMVWACNSAVRGGAHNSRKTRVRILRNLLRWRLVRRARRRLRGKGLKSIGMIGRWRNRNLKLVWNGSGCSAYRVDQQHPTRTLPSRSVVLGQLYLEYASSVGRSRHQSCGRNAEIRN
jgi:hypothetical protein